MKSIFLMWFYKLPWSIFAVFSRWTSLLSQTSGWLLYEPVVSWLKCVNPFTLLQDICSSVRECRFLKCLCLQKQMVSPPAISGVKHSDHFINSSVVRCSFAQLSLTSFCWLLNWPLLSPAFLCPFSSSCLFLVFSPLPDVHAPLFCCILASSLSYHMIR